MERKFLKDFGIADEAIEKIMAENGRDIENLKSSQTTAQTTISDLQKQLGDRDKQLETLKKSSGDNETLKQQIAQLQEQNKTAKAEYDGNLKKLTLSSRIETALLGAKARDVKAARALLDESKLSLDGENVLGLNDQLDTLKKDKAWLFGEDKPNSNPPAPAGGNPPPMDTSKLSDEEFYAQAFKKK